MKLSRRKILSVLDEILDAILSLSYLPMVDR
jgi:hypothetical protein